MPRALIKEFAAKKLHCAQQRGKKANQGQDVMGLVGLWSGR